MIVSRGSRALLAGLALAALALPGCRSPAGAPPRSAFRPALRPPPSPPDVAHRTALDLARAALVSDSDETARALERMQAIETVLAASEEPGTGLLGVSIDLRNTTLDDRRAYRQTTRSLLERHDLDPALRARLELFRDDAPLELAHDRIRDAWQIEFGRAFNALAEPVGRSIMSHKLAPYRLGRSLVNYAVQIYTREALILQRRQALAHWKEFVERNPGAPETEDLVPKMKKAQGLWHRTQRDRALRVARQAMRKDKVRLALVYSDRALRHVPEDETSYELRAEASDRLLALRAQQQRSQEAAAAVPQAQPGEARELAFALLLPGGDVAGAARQLRAADPQGPLADEAIFAEALALAEVGDEDASWALLEELADGDLKSSNMARHAAALVNNPDQNTYGAFRQARGRERTDRAKWLVVGPFYGGARPLGLPGPLDWVVQAPSIAENVFGAPMRLLNLPWAAALPSTRLTAVYARRHLERYPDSPHAAEISAWLEKYEKKRGNFVAALLLLEERDDVELAELAELREKAARQYLEAALRERSLEVRIGMYNQVALTYPGSRAARAAGDVARREVDHATAQQIQITRGFLEENPEVWGPMGLGLHPELLDDEPTNAELHPDGVALLGSRVIEVSYLAPSGDEDDPPRRVPEVVSERHLARIVSQLEETSYRNMLLDPGDDVAPDARRDLFFERVRLGLASEVDQRPGAASSYRYRGLRERYGMVRARESILPFDIVFSGNIHDLSIGAFPRIRRPRETEDAILFR